MKRALIVAGKVQKGLDTATIDESKVLGLYQFYRESMCDISDLENNDKFSDLNIPIDVIALVFEKYEVVKARSHKYDFTDMLWRFYNLLESNPEVLESVQGYYEYVIADEVQDFTPLMWSILQLLVCNKTPLTCIGDEDQNIYRFRGADIYNLLNFCSVFPESNVYSLIQNRRCSKEILDYSKDVIHENKLRFNKSIEGSKPGGYIKFVSYNSNVGQLISVVKELEKMGPEEQQKSVICYRDSICSALLVDLLEEKEIPFHVIRGKQPLSHELYRHVVDALNILSMPCDRMVLLNLYKVLPCSRDKIYEVLGYNPERRTFSKEDNKLHFSQYYYGELLKIKGFVDAMEKLLQLSSKIEREPLSGIFPEVYDLLEKYYWRYKKSNNPELDTDTLFEERIKKFFNTERKYTDVIAELGKRRSICSKNTESGAGVAVATFHSLKGLEFDTVFTIFMDNDIFPNFPLIENRGYPSTVEQELKESETRLWYVAVTRAKNKLIVYYNKDNPSKYVVDALNLSSDNASMKLNEQLYNSADFIEISKEEETVQKTLVEPSAKPLDMFIDDMEDFVDSESFVAEAEVLKEPDNLVKVSKNAYMERLLFSL